MAEESQAKVPSLAEQYSLLKTEETKQDNVENISVPEVKTTEEEKPAEVTAEEVAVTTGAAPEGGAEVATENTEEEKLSEAAQEAATPAAEVEDTATTETVAAVEEGDAEEVQPEIKIETAPADFRFPTTNQTRHCFTRYVEYHRCVAAKGEDAPECDKFAKYYRSLCPSEWVERWNEQRENGTFPGPL